MVLLDRLRKSRAGDREIVKGTLAGGPFLLLVAVITGLAYAALTVLPRTLEALRP